MELYRFNNFKNYKKINEAVDNTIEHRNQIETMVKNMQVTIKEGNIKKAIFEVQSIKNELEELLIKTTNKHHIIHYKGDNCDCYIKIDTSELIAEVDFTNLIEKYGNSRELEKDLLDFENNEENNPMRKEILRDIYEYNKIGGIGPDLSIDFNIKPIKIGENKYRITLKKR
jgi:hypothetical protein